MRQSATIASPQTTTRRCRVRFAAVLAFGIRQELCNSPSTRLSASSRPEAARVQRLLLQAHLQQRGNGDVGPVLVPPPTRRRTALLPSAAGPLALLPPCLGNQRSNSSGMGYCAPGAPGIFPLDRALIVCPALFVLLRTPAGAGQAAVHESFPRFGPPTDSQPDWRFRLPNAAWSRSCRTRRKDFDAFYRQRFKPELRHRHHPGGSRRDCKGIPMVKPPGAGNQHLRLTKGSEGQQEAHGHGLPAAVLHPSALGAHSTTESWKACSGISRPTPGGCAGAAASGEQNGYGPVCSRARIRCLFRRWPKRWNVGIRSASSKNPRRPDRRRASAT